MTMTPNRLIELADSVSLMSDVSHDEAAEMLDELTAIRADLLVACPKAEGGDLQPPIPTLEILRGLIRERDHARRMRHHCHERHVRAEAERGRLRVSLEAAWATVGQLREHLDIETLSPTLAALVIDRTPPTESDIQWVHDITTAIRRTREIQPQIEAQP